MIRNAKVSPLGRMWFVSAAISLVLISETVTARPSSNVREARLERSAQVRAPRPDAPAAASLVSPFDSALLAEIAACCCNLTNIVLGCCSITEGVIGSLTDQGICDASLWSTVDGIQNTQQSVIGWLKTIMLELRGLCQVVP